MKVPRGIRNNNPLNIIRTGTKWMGMSKKQTDSRFIVFDKMEYGWRAAFILLTRTYYRKHHLDTIRKIVTRWAPPSDGNHTERYIAYVARHTRRDADAPLPAPWEEPERWQDLAWVMAMMENGNYPMDPDALIKGWDLTGLTPGPSPTGEGG